MSLYQKNNHPACDRVAYQSKQRNYPIKQNCRQAKKSLPSPANVLAMLGLEVPKRTNSKGYFVLKCLFHNDSEPSLNLHSVKGYYNCFSCGAKGSLTNFYMRVTGKNYADAIKELLAWRG